MLMVKKTQPIANPNKSALYKRTLGERQKANEIKVFSHTKESIACYPK